MTASGKAPAFQFYAADWLADRDVRAMTCLERGYYVDLLCCQWLDGEVPADPVERARMYGLTLEEEAAAWGRVGPKFPDGRNPRLEGVRLGLEAYREGQSAKGVRSARMRAARKLGTHSPAEWDAMKAIFALCVRCGGRGLKLTRDHIVPVYQGGSDSIDNIQPLCGPCNSAKGPENTDLRLRWETEWKRWSTHRNPTGVEVRLQPNANSSSSSSSSSVQSKSKTYTLEVRGLCELLFQEAKRWKPGVRCSKDSNQTLEGMDKLLRLDERPAPKVAQVIEWLFRSYEPSNSYDARVNVLSGKSLRIQWDRLENEMDRGSGSKSNGHASAAESAWREVLEWRGRHYVPGVPSKVPLETGISPAAYAALNRASGSHPSTFLGARDNFAEQANRKAFLDAFKALDDNHAGPGGNPLAGK